MKIRVSIISAIYCIFFAFLIFISFKQIKAKTIPASDNSEEPVEIQIIENFQETKGDTLTIKQDSLITEDETDDVEDSLFIYEKDIIFEDSIFTDSIPKKDYKTIIDTTFSPFTKSLFNKRLSHHNIYYLDSNAVYTYLYYKSLPSENADFHFLKNELYSYSYEVDVEKNHSLITAKFGETDIITPFTIPLEQFWDYQFKKSFYDNFYKDLATFDLKKKQTKESEGIIPDIEFPKIKMPKAMRRFFGDNIGRLRVTGSQKITIGGTKTTNKPRLDTESTRRSILPDLNMKQELNLGISGTIGDKIKVDVKQTSEESIFKKNKISIKYEGDEDDPIKLIEGGDTRLSLSGSHFISYSASSEDLFGIKGKFEFGKLKLTTIISQQEGQHASATAIGTSMEGFTKYRDMDFTPNKYFFIGSPNPDDSNTIFREEDKKLIPIDSLMPKEDTEIRIFVDDRKIDPTYITGYSIDDTNHVNSYQFQEYVVTTETADFIIDYINSPYMIEFNKYIGNNYIIGIIYEDRAGDTYGEYGDTLKVKLIKEDYTNVPESDLAQGAALWDYQLKNKYYLGSKNIQSQGFEVEIYRYLPNGEKEEGIIDTTNSTYTPYIEILDLDTNGDGMVNGNDQTVDLEKGVITFQMLEPFRREWFADYDSTLGNDIIYEKLYPDPTDDDFNPFYISVKMKTTAGEINLGQMNVIKNSEKVYIDGDLKKRNDDYTIEYETGIVTFKPDAAPGPNADVKINFEYEPFFALDKKNMFGMRADYEFNKNAALGATIMYEAGSVKDERPKVGNEPKKILVGDIDGKISVDLPFITDLVDMIPLIKTQEKSTFSLSGEVAMNIPNPNATNKQEAYIDDMEGVVESYSLGIGRTDWTFASFPIGIVDTSNIVDTLNPSSRGDMQWYNPYHKFQAKDIYQDLTEREEREYVSVLELEITPTETQTQYWGGIMKAFGSTNFSKKKYLELTMKSDENPGDTLFIDLGYISEDYYPILNPNGTLDEEDGCVNGIKDGELDIGEDIGLDRCINDYENGWGECLDYDGPTYKQYLESGETDTINANAKDPNDPNYDDYVYNSGSDVYDKINGTEGNNKLDSEDLDASGLPLNTTNNYFQYVIDLANINPDIQITEYNGWKFIRIPLQDSTYFTIKGVGSVGFSQIKYARIWAKSNSSSSITIDIASIDVIGNKWKASAILDTTLHTPDNLENDEVFEIATDNNKKNPNYTPPPGSVDKREEKRTKEKQIEQSIFLDCTDIQPNRYLYARQNFVDAVNLLLYDKVKFWVYGQTEVSAETDKETIIFRIGADTSNYYEYRKEINLYKDIGQKMDKDRWQEISIDFVDFSGLKKPDVPDTNKLFRIVGNPSLGYVKQIVVGLLRPDTGDSEFSGKIYFDDIRVANPCDDIGVASLITLTAKVADVLNISASFNNQTPNFYTLGQDRGSGTTKYKYTLNNKITLNKFLPASWGFNIPLKIDYSFSESKPRFQPNSDVELTSEAEKDSLKTLTETKNASITFSKSKKSSNTIVKYLIDNLNLSARISDEVSLSPTRKDTSMQYSGSANYNLSFSKNNSIGILKDFKLYYLPQKVTFKFDYNYSHSDIWKKETGEGYKFIKELKKPDEKLKPYFKIDYEVFSNLQTDYTLQTTRDLQKRNLKKNINIGIESNRTQKINLKYNPSFLKFINFSTKYATNYGQNRRENKVNDTLFIKYEVNNDRTINAGLTLKFNKWGKDLMKAAKLLSSSQKEDRGEEQEIKKDEEPPGKDLLDETEIGEIKNEEKLDSLEIQEQEIKKDEEQPGKDLLDGTEIDEIENKEKLDSLEIQEEEIKKEVSKISHFKRVASISGQVIGFGIKTLGSTKFTYSNNYNTKYFVPSDSLPDFNYRIGLVDLEYGDLKSYDQTNSISISTSNRFNILPTLDADVKVDYKQTFVNKYSGKTNTTSYTLPDITLTYGGLDNIIPWNLVSNSSVSSGANRKVTKTGPTSPSEINKITLNSSISLPINVLKTLNPKLSGSYTYSYDKNSNTKIENKDNRLTFSAGMKYSFQSEKGIKIPLLKRIKMKNKLDTNLDISYTSNFNQKYLPNNKIWDPQINTNDLKIEPRVSYSFSKDINGGLTGKYDYSKNKKSGKSTHSTALNIWVEFKF